RPFVHALASRCGLSGFVRNEGDAVRIEVEGEPDALQHFQIELKEHPPPGARIAKVLTEEIPAERTRGFVVEASRDPDTERSFAPADVATCAECLAELFDPANRRHRYAFISCAHCGPRFTAISRLPYDRERTTMAAFPLCAACAREYENPADRRFHAQT